MVKSAAGRVLSWPFRLCGLLSAAVRRNGSAPRSGRPAQSDARSTTMMTSSSDGNLPGPVSAPLLLYGVLIALFGLLLFCIGSAADIALRLTAGAGTPDWVRSVCFWSGVSVWTGAALAGR